jgi:hypothetical protein
MTRTIELQNSDEVVTVSLADYDELSKYHWFKTNSGYAFRNKVRENGTILMHREILGLEGGNKLQCDHINGDKLDNRRENLRVVTTVQNHYNCNKHKDNTSGFRGVYYDKKWRKWAAQTKDCYKRVTIGGFATAIEAARAYDAYVFEHFGEFARLNFPMSESRSV